MKTSLHGRTRLMTIITALALIATTATIAWAQTGTAPPKLAYSMSLSAAPAGPTTAAPGPTTFAVSSNTSKETDFTVLHLQDGVNAAEVQKAIDTKLSEDEIEALPVTIVGGTGEAAKGRPASFTISLVPGTYLVANTTNEKRTPSIVLTVSGAANGAVAATPVTTVKMHDYKFELSRSLPRSGIVRVTNPGKRVHMMIAFKTQNAAGAKRAIKALRSGKEKAFNKEIRGFGSSADPISPGATVDIPVHYGKGSYVLVCFWQSKASKGKPHFALGMTKATTVK